MPTLTVTHEAPLELIRQCPDVAVDLVRTMTPLSLPGDVKATLGPTSLNAVVPAEFTADSVVVVTDPATGTPVLIIVIEPQGREDRTKAYSWPAYLANAREAVKCPSAILLVICPDPREAEKCRQVIKMGHPEWDLRPIVIDPLNAPAEQGASPYLTLFLACLPALDMTTEAGARRVLSAIRETGASDANRLRLTAIILSRASEAARKILEVMMQAEEWHDDFIESYVKIGVDQGREVGAAENQAKNLLKLLDARGIELTTEQRAMVTAEAGLAKLELWFNRALTPATADEVFTDDEG